MSVLPLRSYGIIIGMDLLERNKVILNYYEKSFVYKDEHYIAKKIQGIKKLVSVRKISTMQFKK